MGNVKIRPAVSPSSKRHDDLLIQLPADNECIDYRNCGSYWIDQLPRRQEYRSARRAFLNSYHFSEDRKTCLGRRLKRSMTGMNKAAMGVVLEVRQELSKRRFVIRIFRLKLTFPSKAHICLRCFVPSFRKVETFTR